MGGKIEKSKIAPESTTTLRPPLPDRRRLACPNGQPTSPPPATSQPQPSANSRNINIQPRKLPRILRLLLVLSVNKIVGMLTCLLQLEIDSSSFTQMLHVLHLCYKKLS